jgi:hypothetical protein
MPRRDLGVAGEGELAEVSALTPFAQMAADRSGSGRHGAKLAQPPIASNYLTSKLFLTAKVIEIALAIGEISGGGIAPDASMMEPKMDNLTELIDRYIAMWNETDAERRRALIARTWTEDASYLDPMLQGEGRAGIDAMVCGVHERFPGHRFRRTSDVDTHHDRVRFSWELAPEGGAVVARGIDFGIVAPDQRLRTVTGFFDHVATS